MKQHIFATERTKSLTEALFSLEEPWRGRFLDLLANGATNRAWDGRPPTREEVTTWLSDSNLYQEVTLLLNAWQGGGDVSHTNCASC